MAEPEEFEYESLQDAESIGGYLHALAEGLARGHLALRSDGKQLVLKPTGLLRVGVQARRSKQRARLVVKVSWRVDRRGAEQQPAPLHITTEPTQE